MDKVFVILNPVAGNSQPDKLRALLQKRFSQTGQKYEIHETTAQESIAEVVRQALSQGFELFIVAGGDGTVSGVADGLAKSGSPMGIIPVGTGNELARNLELPLDEKQALDLILGEHIKKGLDALKVGERFFVLNVSVGLSPKIMRETRSDAKRRFGRLAYLWNMIARLSGLNRYRFMLSIDEREVQIRAVEILVLNSKTIGIPYRNWGPDIHLDDGRVEILSLRPRAIFDYFRIAWNVLRGQPHRDPGVRFFRAEQQIVIHANKPLAVQGDGDVIGQTPVVVGVMPKAVQVLTPHQQK